jgi:hypothetical protein
MADIEVGGLKVERLAIPDWRCVIDWSVEDWRRYVRKKGWPYAQALQQEFGFQLLGLRARISAGAEAGERGTFEGLVEYYRMEVALVVLNKSRLELDAPEVDRAELQTLILAQEQMNANIREMIAIWKWRRGLLDA